MDITVSYLHTNVTVLSINDDVTATQFGFESFHLCDSLKFEI